MNEPEVSTISIANNDRTSKINPSDIVGSNLDNKKYTVTEEEYAKLNN
jgi:hypothetical protein